MTKRECPFCKIKISDFAHHISIKHNIRNEEEYRKKIDEIQNNKLRQEDFSNYVDQLKKSMREGEITPEKYRELITQWRKEHGEI
ncbi:hypothetical protein [Nitrosopumilus piranensis]|uniref:C2H2-type domain-containing protein n=1 Tax=Nitrosopumilus piranensis TaxID=1582439 RepID=A0A0C5CAK2_9ARCH|nr:hypothetical protein [Nitrosopumilus piranensis]AJM92202.1 hypothetical protein NPIRD3C_0990 [Nitrosopumilus piranensis]